MRMTVGTLRSIINEVIAGSEQSEAYDRDLVDDPELSKHSVIVPDDVKKPVKKWLRSMGLARKKALG